MNMAIREDAASRFRTIWISDIHLGTRGCQAELLLDFLKHTESNTLYPAGDIIDGWRLKKSWYWAQSHNDVIQKVLRKARKISRTACREFALGFTWRACAEPFLGNQHPIAQID